MINEVFLGLTSQDIINSFVKACMSVWALSFFFAALTFHALGNIFSEKSRKLYLGTLKGFMGGSIVYSSFFTFGHISLINWTSTWWGNDKALYTFCVAIIMCTTLMLINAAIAIMKRLGVFVPDAIDTEDSITLPLVGLIVDMIKGVYQAIFAVKASIIKDNVANEVLDELNNKKIQ